MNWSVRWLFLCLLCCLGLSLFGLFRGAAALNGVVLLVVVSFLAAKGWRAINWGFLTQPPAEAMTRATRRNMSSGFSITWPLSFLASFSSPSSPPCSSKSAASRSPPRSARP